MTDKKLGRPPKASTEKVLEVIRTHSLEQEHTPSLSELSKSLGVSTRTVRRYLDRLEEEGLIERLPGPEWIIVVNSE